MSQDWLPTAYEARRGRFFATVWRTGLRWEWVVKDANGHCKREGESGKEMLHAMLAADRAIVECMLAAAEAAKSQKGGGA